MSGRRVGLRTAARVAQSSQHIHMRLADRGFTADECPIESESENGWEAQIAAGRFDIVVELVLVDMLDAPNGDRLTGAAMAGVPQVIVPGGLDLASEQQLDRLAKEVAHKASAARARTAVFVPTLAWADREPVNPRLVSIFDEALRMWLAPSVEYQVRAEALADAAFADALADWITSTTTAAAFRPPVRPFAFRP